MLIDVCEHGYNLYMGVYLFLHIVGCTNLKHMFEVLKGVFKANESVPHYKIHGNHLKIMMYMLSASEKKRRLNEYYKFMILRDPTERVLSSFIDKVIHALELYSTI